MPGTPERTQVAVSVLVQPQCRGKRVEHLRRRVDLPRLLELRVPRHADGGETGNLVTAEPRHAATPGRWQADVLGSQLRTARPQECRQLGTSS